MATGAPSRLPTPLRVLLLLVVSAALAAYLYAAGRYCYASRLGHSGDEAKVSRALALTPDNAELHEWLGLYHFYSGETDRGTAELRAASALQPQSSRIWLDLAMAYHLPGRFSDQRQALDQALKADPTTPRVLWEVASFLLAAGERENSYPLFRRIIADDQTRSEQAIDLLWRSSHDAGAILDAHLLPARPDSYLALLGSIVVPHAAFNPADPTLTPDLAQADLVWDRLVALHQPVQASRIFLYFDELLRLDRAERLAEVWQQMATLDPAVKARVTDGDIINNGSFEQDPLQGGLDWRFSSTDAVTVSVDGDMANVGLRSLRLDFQGAEAANIPCVQYLIVEPGTRYHFTGYLRSRDLLSTSGPRLAVYDPQTATLLYKSDDILGTAGWREESGDFTTGPATRVLTVSVLRDPSDRRIEGTAWIDDLSLKKQP